MSWKGATPSTQFGANNNTGTGSNVPDYQKMLQHHIFSTGWGTSASKATSDRYNRHSSYPTVSPSGTISPPLATRTRHTDSLATTNYSDPKIYNSYQPSKYGLSSDSQYDVSYVNKEFGELNVENTVNVISDDTFDKTAPYAPTKYEYKSYDSSDPYKKRSKANSYVSSRPRTTDFDLERPNIAADDTDWSSPTKRTSLDVPQHLFMTPARSRSSVTEAVDYGRVERPARQTGTTKSAIDDLYQNKHYVENGDAHVTERPPRTRGRDSSGRRPVSVGAVSSDLTNWQKHHQDQLVHQQIEKEGGFGKTGGQGFDRLFNHISNGEENSEKWNSVKHAADAVISEKDMYINKLKMQNMQLEEDNKQYEAKLRRALMSESDQGNEAYSQIKDLEMKNVTMKSDMSELRSRNKVELEELEIKLGAAEHEVMQLRTALRKRVPEFQDDLHSKIDQLEDEKEEWKMKFLEVKDSHHSLKQKQEELQRYLTGLPTLEEAARQDDEIRAYSEDNKLQKERIEELQQELFDTRKNLSSRDLQIEEMENKGKQLGEKLSILTDEIDRFKSIGQGAALRLREEELQKLQEENDRFSTDLDKAKKLLETCHRKIRHQDVKHQNSVKSMEERLCQEEEMVNALREEGRLRDEQGSKIKATLKQLQSQNQELLDQNLTMREHIKHLEQQHSDDNQRLQRQFTTELGICFSELQALVQICVQRAEGQDPNMSDLLGVRADVETAATGGPQVEAQTMKHWLSKTRELRTEIEQLRVMICNKYAEDIGDNLNCTTQ
ncbi:centrosomal protein of 85 kDa-like [Mizuhopecten yessoensis]|uniref:Centrosomal protein of 85 kDa n=1 Tax=Mizuhopecten yessoensis TaxID=6573 RepID=A0A210QUN2_MIZYE|nr:centrosomal protein of 85 kDa-like [Mizuhopecten yessoensis]XP_021349222.1 centrosomal protein of 85 kDa-like [Mizuhopecten yessoensis]OWF52460.1 Centrosomal protein of 85 kDa [Mizuhopecten yessoensis]